MKFEPKVAVIWAKIASCFTARPAKADSGFRDFGHLAADFFFYPSGSDGSRNDVDSSNFSSDKDSPIQQPQTSAGAARKS